MQTDLCDTMYQKAALHPSTLCLSLHMASNAFGHVYPSLQGPRLPPAIYGVISHTTLPFSVTKTTQHAPVLGPGNPGLFSFPEGEKIMIIVEKETANVSGDRL